MDNNANDNGAPAAISAPSIKVLAFTTQDPELFFMSLESQFHYVIGALPEAILVKVKDLIQMHLMKS